jgi:dihydrofolate synthase/folylpolyglutamate synthase
MVDIDGYNEAVKYVESFNNISFRKNFGGDRKDPQFFIDRTKYFLRLLDNPEKCFSYIHITGTAGKGTVSTMLQEILVASGKMVGLFTSPYVTTTIDQIRVGERYISPADFIEFVSYLKPYVARAQKGQHGGVSAFELLFAIALLYFKKQKCEWVVLEVGLGGRYDATNVIACPIVTAITNIDYDHTEILGNTLLEIAHDKAGIIKTGSLFFTSEQRPRIQSLFKKACDDVGAEFFSVGRQSNHTLHNIELSKSIARAIKIPERHIEQGLRRVNMPCRFEVIQHDPTIVLDGAHNRAKIQSTVADLGRLSFGDLYLIVAIANNKNDNRAILKHLVCLPYTTHIILTQVRTGERRTLSPKLLLSIAKKYREMAGYTKPKSRLHAITFACINDSHDALKSAVKVAKKDDVILVTGSFFLSGELRKSWISERSVLNNRKSSMEGILTSLNKGVSYPPSTPGGVFS